LLDTSDPLKTPQSNPVLTWHAMSADEALAALDTQPQAGLTSEDAKNRLSEYGYNQLAEKPRPGFFKMVLAQLNNFIVILLIIAAVVSALLGEWIDAGAIFAIVVLNAILGVIQESRAEQALAALKKLAAPDAQTLRDGIRVTIPASELVPGDIVFLEAGTCEWKKPP
jgi:Ca2+-transporting ATPase